jgi:hypothetical protein
MAMPRALSRGNPEHAGRRRVARWLNDNLVFASGDGSWAGLSEADVADRLAHMLISIDGRERGLGSLLTQAAAEDATAFRRGEVGARAPSKKGADRMPEGSITVAGLLNSMYGRVGVRLRPALLRETRASLAAQGDETSVRPFMLDAELLVLSILDGTLAGLLAAAVEERGGADVNRPPCPLPWAAGPEWVHSCAGPAQMGVCPDVELPCVYVPLSSPYLRCVLHGLASFYGLLAESVPVEDCPRLWPGVHGGASGSASAPSATPARALRFALPTRTRAARVEREAINAVRHALAEAWGSGPGASTDSEQMEPAGAAAAPPALTPPIVPLLHVHVRTISDSTPTTRCPPKHSFGKQYKTLSAAPTSSGRSAGGSGRRAAVAPPAVPHREREAGISLTVA